ncbi:serpin family protein [Tellurirhabdus bombi]|uniref:serpin family protein n=1 Tax=Tellurirhabdus bombi TaxID=2907205 RepID=UPI001F3F23FD|nr:serpin family protein [Tellurirhabdus bombi]
MKSITSIVTTLAIPALTLALTVSSCQRDNALTPEQGTFQPTAGARQFATKTNDFSFNFLKEVNAAQRANENIFVSPLSMHMALGMLLNGANGTTAEEIKKVLKLDDVSLTEANQIWQQLLEGLPNADPKVTTTLANAIFHDNNFASEAGFLTSTTDYFKARVAAEDFTNQATVGKINQWASDNTNGKIKKIVNQIQPNEVLFLLNALYFKGDWKYQFNAEQTQDRPFELVDGGQKTVRMMQLNRELRRAFRPNYTAFELPYGDGTYSMTVMLPKETSSADALIKSLSANEWNQLQNDMTAGSMMIGLPKFTLEYEGNLNGVLSKLGMPTAFTDLADFSKISTKKGLTVTSVKQNTFVAVDEKGTEAAAVTGIGVGVTSAPASYFCDRPFVIAITEKQTGAVLFMGKIVNPESK